MNRARAAVALGLLLLMSIQGLPVSAAPSATPSQASAVVLTIIPPKLPADGGVYPAAVVSLADASNLPTAAFGNVTVFLSSDQTNIASVPQSVTIQAGHEYAIANITTTSTPGTATITASVQGLKSTITSIVTTITPSGYPSKLLVFSSPSVFLPRVDTGVLRVEVVDQAGLPSKAISPINVLLTSSNSSIASLAQTSLTIQTGTILADGSVNTVSPGSAVITATSTGYATGATLVTVNKPNACLTSCGPNKLALRVVVGGSPGTLPTDGQGYAVLEVGLQTTASSPAVSSSDTVVQLSSDNPNLLSVPALVSIPAGSISVLTTVTTSALAGTANITATSPGLLPATSPVKTVIPAPSKLQAYIAPPQSAYMANDNYPIMVVQLQDSSGNPARARQDTSVLVTSQNNSILSSFVTLGIPAGRDYVFTYLHVKEVGSSVLTVSSEDLASSQVQLALVPSPLVVDLVLLSAPNGFIYDNQTATFQFSVSFVGQPVRNLNVTWGSTKGTMSPGLGNTGTGGSSSSRFTPASYGSYNITASADSPQTGSIVKVFSLLVAQTPVRPAPSLAQQILSYWYYLVAAAAVVVVAVVYLLRMRRKKQRAEIEAGFEVV